MKILIAVIVALGLAVSAVAQEWQEFDLVRGRAGFMVIGKSFYDGLRPSDTENIKIDGKDPSILEIYRVGKKKPHMRVETKVETDPFLDYIVKTITVFDPQFRTDFGVGVGSTLGDIRSKYLEVQAELFMEGYLAIVGELSMYFHLEPPLAAPVSSARVFRTLSREEGGGKTTGVAEEVTDNWRVVSITVR